MQKAPTAVVAIRKLNKMTGAARIALQQISILSAMGYNVTVLCEKADAANIHSTGGTLHKISTFPFKGLVRRRWFSARANAWRLRHKPDLVISHGDSDNADIVFMHNCVDLAQGLIYPEAADLQSDVSKMHRKIMSQGAFKKVVANSRLMANDLSSRYNLPEDKIEVSYPGYNPKQFNASVKINYREARRDELGIKKQEKLIGLVTSGDFKKRNLSLFIDIADCLVKKATLNYRFLVIGQGNTAAYKEKAEKLNIGHHFIWKKTVPNVEQYYAALDLFMLPAHIEEFGCVVLEAMACSTLPLISERVGAGEILEGDYKQLIVSGYDACQWAQASEKILMQNNDLLSNQVANRASQFTYEYQYKALKTLLSQFF
ncbi:glycosyltransferase [Halomonas sp. GT]|uniref:glycosyltransferase n=1 Tax=Halomonas sp. GT TaxID=1971364 RepID=UPI0009F4B61F|nr:glycosyltransferase [Halomonas sp. GT]